MNYLLPNLSYVVLNPLYSEKKTKKAFSLQVVVSNTSFACSVQCCWPSLQDSTQQNSMLQAWRNQHEISRLCRCSLKTWTTKQAYDNLNPEGDLPCKVRCLLAMHIFDLDGSYYCCCICFIRLCNLYLGFTLLSSSLAVFPPFRRQRRTSK